MLGENWEEKSKSGQKEYSKLLKNSDRNEVLNLLPDLHDRAFDQIDCLECGACCKNYSPRFKPPDIRRISKHLGMKQGDFSRKYLHRDDEGDSVLKSKPCPFLDEDNFCGIYEVRPSDCRRFPYTDEDVLIDKPDITLKNSSFCPAVYLVLEMMEETIKQR